MRDIPGRLQSVEDARYFARRRLPKFLFQLFESGAGAGLTVRDNERAFEEVHFLPRAGVSHPARNLTTTVLGHRISMPVLAAPVGLLRFGHRDGEAGVARAAGSAGTIQIVSGATSTPVEEIVAAASGPIFYQVYFFDGARGGKHVVERAQRAGCDALVVTLDTPSPASPREWPYRHRARMPQTRSLADSLEFGRQAVVRPSWLLDFARARGTVEMAMALREDGTAMEPFEAFPLMYRQTPTWEDMSWIRSTWNGPIVLKGILTVADARRAVQHGADAIVVSNHGGNSLDGSLPSLRALPAIVDAVGDRVEVLMDGGVRRGSDVVKAVALGARATLIGRAYLFPLLAAGEAGVRHMLRLFGDQIGQTLAFLGVRSVSELDPSLVSHPPHWGRP